MQDQEDPPVVVEAETVGVEDDAPIIHAVPAPPAPASRATIRTASTLRPWITVIAPHWPATITTTARERAALVRALLRLSRPSIRNLCRYARIPTPASLPSSTTCFSRQKFKRPRAS